MAQLSGEWPDLCYIANVRALAELCQKLSSQQWITIDTEFGFVKEFHPRLSLIQIATLHPPMIYLVDVIRIRKENIKTLFDEILCNTRILKVFHSCKQDLVLLHAVSGQLVSPVFDSQEAYGFLENEQKISYKRLVEVYCEISLDKSCATSNWIGRPLDQTQLEYAANDVKYLASIYPLLQQQLVQRGKLKWAYDRFEMFTSEPLYSRSRSWLNLKISKDLTPEQFGMLHILSLWRSDMAVQRNVPPTYLLTNEELLQIATSADPQWRNEKLRYNFTNFLNSKMAMHQQILDFYLNLYPIYSNLDDILARFQEIIAECSEQHGTSRAALASYKEQLLFIFEDPLITQSFMDPNKFWYHLIGASLTRVLHSYRAPS